MEYFSGFTDALRITFVQMMIIAIISIMIFLYGMIINMRKWGLGSTGYGLEPSSGSARVFLKTLIAQIRSEGHGQPFLVTLVLDILLQRRILRRSPLRWFMHITIFVGWMALFIISLIMFAFEVLELIGFDANPAALREMVSVPNDVFSYILLVGITIAILRRLFITNIRENTIAFDSILLVGLTLITITGFISDGIRNGTFWGFGIDNATAPPAALFHVVISLLFCIAYIPYSKYMHMLATPLTILANKGGE
ncbi:MAG: disulfide reductase [Methanosarcinaceae archaeon]|nr:disulfide reductase [Methanosarcinaceae archaeon]MDF1534272.1 disulfide reductase [Methanosarcinaceae archaeon]